MRKSVFAVVLALVAMFGAYGPVAAAQTSTAKVVIIVGATHGETAKYRSNADELYAEAIQHTPNVTKVYSPNATWSAVKAATVGANIVIYLGHGNGWPSPYTYDPSYTTKDGFGLNATAGNGDSNNKYYGEPSISDARPGPECDRVPAPPLLRLGQLRARRSGPLGERRPAARRQLRRRVPRRRRVGGHRRRPQPHRLLPAGTVHDRPATLPAVARCPELPRPRHHLHPDPKHRDGGPRSGQWRQQSLGLSTARSSAT